MSPPRQIAPDMFAYRPFGVESTAGNRMVQIDAAVKSMIADGAQLVRFREISGDYARPPYPDGIYLEGWSLPPDAHEPPGIESEEFSFPLHLTREDGQ